jgi:ParB-like chromosome segregation protein Spo0J
MPLMSINSISIGSRIRQDLGDLQSLADSIAAIGLLQPIGITTERELVFGERRLRAVRDILHWDQIETRLVDLESIVLGEFHENVMRKDFTISERVAIGKAIEEYLGERRGRPPIDGQENRKNFCDFPEGTRSDQLAAEKAGFGNETTYRQAKTVVEQAEPELLQAVDTGNLSISQAVKAVEAPPEIQRQVAELAQAGQVKEARAVIQDPKILQIWEDYPELKAKDIPTQHVVTMAETLDQMDDATRMEKREELRTRTPGVLAELAQLPPIPPPDETDEKAEQDIQWHKACNQITTLLNGLEETGYLQGTIPQWTMETQQHQLKSFMRLRDQISTIVEALETAIHAHEVSHA